MDYIYYWQKGERVQNFGDYLAEFFMEELFYPIGNAKNCVFIGGSVIDDLFVPEPQDDNRETKIVFWGSGVRTKGGPSEHRRKGVQFLAVRGTATASALRLGAAVPIGDPAFLLPALYTPRPANSFINKTVCIPHFHDQRSDEELRKLSGCDEVLRPNLSSHTSELRRFIDAVGSAKFVLSAAMHGAVTAAAYNRPFGFWDNGEIDVPLKWEEIAEQLSIPLVFSSSLPEALANYEKSIRPAVRIPSLIASLSRAPFPIRPAALLNVVKFELANAPAEKALSKLESIISLFERQSELQDDALTDIGLGYADTHRRLAAAQEAATGLQRELSEQKRELAFQVERGKSLERREELRLTSVRRTFEESTSWKLTKPLRAAARRIPDSTRNGRYFKLAKYLVTFQVDPIKRKLATSTRPARMRLRQILTKPVVARENAIESPPSSLPIKREHTLKDKAGKRHALIIDSVYPRPNEDSGSVDAMNLILSLKALGYDVSFLPTAEFASDSPNKRALEATGVSCPSSRNYASPEEVIKSLGRSVDVCILSRVHAGGAFMESVRRHCVDAKVIFNTVDLHFLREQRDAHLKGDRKLLNLALRTKERELALIRLADTTVVVSEAEDDLLKKIVPGSPVYTLPLARAVVRSNVGFSERRGVGFIGGYAHTPNVDAVHHFLDSIWPIVRKQLPDVEFYAMGADMPADIINRREPGFVALGHVPDLAGALSKIRVMVAPLRTGAGAKGKVATSLAHGVPCVLSPIAAEGMGLSDGKNVAVGETDESFAAHLVEMYLKADKWAAMSEAGLALMEKEFSLDANRERISKLLLSAGAPAPIH
ncbi:glycosyltransferase [Afipia massiliensis]|uniref:Glycosyltransferase n=1 Tax=Afipia massiliensis TaxID=211460 RepID=A0A4U6BR12_9BRAD|nr:glycosyltransferase [Afipia massiliensis]TKT71438.1 glycosyltransferase [Afipia massiliensis]